MISKLTAISTALLASTVDALHELGSFLAIAGSEGLRYSSQSDQGMIGVK